MGGGASIRLDRPMSRLSYLITLKPSAVRRSTSSSGQPISCAPRPMTSRSGVPSALPWTSYSRVIPFAFVEGIRPRYGPEVALRGRGRCGSAGDGAVVGAHGERGADGHDRDGPEQGVEAPGGGSATGRPASGRTGLSNRIAERVRQGRHRVPFGDGLQRPGAWCRRGTKVLATKVRGNRATKAMPVTPSGVPTTLPSRTPTQIMAKANASIRP